MSEQLDEGEYKFIRVGTHLISVCNVNGKPEVNIRDHMELIVEGEHKDNVNIVYTSGEFGSSFNQIGEREYWEQYHK